MKKEENQRTYTSYINLGKQNEYQAVYASQLYGTFFGVYAKFVSDKDGSGKYTIKHIDFELINYKGLANIGISSIRAFKSPNDGKDVIEITVQAGNPNTDYSFTVPNIVVQQNDTLRFERIVKKIDNTTAAVIFDDEFSYRDGLSTPINRAPDPNHNHPHFSENIMYPGRICANSEVTIM